MNQFSLFVFLIFLDGTVTSRLQAYCTTSQWVAVAGKRLDSVVQLNSSCQELNECKSECSSRSDCVSFDCQTASGVQNCRLFGLHGSLIDDVGSTHWQQRRTCTTTNGMRCDFIYIGHYVMTSSSMVSLTSDDEETCLLTCLSASSCSVATYLDTQCQQWSEWVQTETRPVSGGRQFRKECQVNFMSAVLASSITYYATQTNSLYHTSPRRTTQIPMVRTTSTIRTASTIRTTTETTNSTTMQSAVTCQEATYRHLFIGACVLIVLLCVAVGLAYHRKRLRRRRCESETGNDNEMPTTCQQVAEGKDGEYYLQRLRAANRYANEPCSSRNRPVYQNSPESDNDQTIYENGPNVPTNYENVLY